jgi:hypothetical protein
MGDAVKSTGFSHSNHLLLFVKKLNAKTLIRNNIAPLLPWAGI